MNELDAHLADRVFAERKGSIDEFALRQIGERLLTAMGYDVDSPALRDTPARWARWWLEFHQGQDANLDSTFDVKTSGQLVVVSGITVWSICEHHLLPFSMNITIGYQPGGTILGLSKFARISIETTRRLQVQERIVEEIADAISAATGTKDVCVIGRGRHLCMEARGVRSQARTDTVIARGIFEADQGKRADVIQLSGLMSA